jgi:hypothetical protein
MSEDGDEPILGVGQPLDRSHCSSADIGPRLTAGSRHIFTGSVALPQIGPPGLDLVGHAAFPFTVGNFSELGFTLNFDLKELGERLRRLHSAWQVTRDDASDRKAREPGADGGCLAMAEVGEWGVGLADEPALPVAFCLTVADD